MERRRFIATSAGLVAAREIELWRGTIRGEGIAVA
jgi:hypothetical protein